MNPLIFHQNSSHGPSMFNHCSGCKRSKRSVDYQRSGSRRFLLPLFLLEHQSFHEVLVFLCLSLSHHHKPGCLPSWQWMESLWNWRRGGWPLALYGEDKTPSGRPTLHKTSSIISFAQATDWPASAMLSSQTPQEKGPKKMLTPSLVWFSVLFCMCSTSQPGLQPFLRSRALALPWATLTTQLYEIQNSSAVDGLFGGRPFSWTGRRVRA